MGASGARVAVEGGRLSLHWSDSASWTDLAVKVALQGSPPAITAGWTRQNHSTFSAEAGPISVTATMEGEEVALRLRAAAVTEVLEVELAGALAPKPEWLLAGGYQSWDDSSYARDAGISWWAAAVAGAGGAGLAAAAQSATSAATRFELDRGRFAVVWCEPRGLTDAPLLWQPRAGEERHLERVKLRPAADVQTALQQLMPRSTRSPVAVPRGWLSWYHFGPWVSADDIRRHGALLAESPWKDLGYRIVQIDDGWQLAYGDWQPNEKFPDGLAGVAREMAELGHTTGLWTAPLLVSEASQLAASAPDDWFVKDPGTGARAVDPRHGVFGPMHVLDGRNPDVRSHLTALFSRLRGEGIDYFKIDFLYAGAYAGTSALRQAVEAIRAGIGADAYLLGCGAPLLPMLDLVDGCRIGPDTATPVYDFELGRPKPSIFGEEVLAVARDVGFRHHLAPCFQLDADVALVGGNLSLEQGRQLVTLAALSGGPFFASDDLDALEPERRALLTNEEILALVGGPAAVPDWEPNQDRRSPRVWRRPDGVVAIFNWEEAPAEIKTEVGGAARIRDLWTGAEEPVQGGVSASLPPHGVRVVRLLPGYA